MAHIEGDGISSCRTKRREMEIFHKNERAKPTILLGCHELQIKELQDEGKEKNFIHMNFPFLFLFHSNFSTFILFRTHRAKMISYSQNRAFSFCPSGSISISFESVKNIYLLKIPPLVRAFSAASVEIVKKYLRGIGPRT